MQQMAVSSNNVVLSNKMMNSCRFPSTLRGMWLSRLLIILFLNIVLLCRTFGDGLRSFRVDREDFQIIHEDDDDDNNNISSMMPMYRNPFDDFRDEYLPLPFFTLSTDFPPLESTLENVMLSNLIYALRSCDPDDLPDEDDYYNDVVWPSYLTCHSYHKKKDGTEVAVVYSDEKKYVAIVYAGTDSIPDTWIDTQIKLVPIGPTDAPIVPNNDTIKVHSGFNKQVFKEGLYSTLYDEVSELLNNHTDYNLIVTGHSLGASNSILTAVALGNEFPDRSILNINVAAPKCGNEEFREYANSFDNVAIWRLVNLNDIVPRLPNLYYYKHPGHTIQFDNKGAEAYYLHYGDEDLGYAGVPSTWGDRAYLNPVTASMHHMIKHYVHYLREMSLVDPKTYYIHEFVPLDNSDTYTDSLIDEALLTESEETGTSIGR